MIDRSNYVMGTHWPALERALDQVPTGGLVVEHGAGLYSTVLIARHGSDARFGVVCVETQPLWAEWAEWAYRKHGIDAKVVAELGPAKLAINFGSVSLLFVDGDTKARVKLLEAALAMKVPLIVAHDTERDAWGTYHYEARLFSPPGYEVEHDNGRPRTTTWRLVPPPAEETP